MGEFSVSSWENRLRCAGGRQLAVDDQVGRLDEGGVLGQLLDRIAAVAEDAGLAVDEGDGALAGAGVAVALVVGDVAGVGAQIADIDRLLALRADDDGKVDSPCCRA